MQTENNGQRAPAAHGHHGHGNGSGALSTADWGAFRLVHRLATGIAVTGGAVLLGMALMTCLSVLSRLILGQPIPGIFELVELFTGIAVLSFFPYTHAMRGNVTADFFTQKAPLRMRQLLDIAADFAFLAIAVFIFWRIGVGLIESFDSLDRSFVLNLPKWVFYTPATLWTGLLVVVALAIAMDGLTRLDK